MLQGFLIGLGGESFFAAVRRGANLYFFTTGHHFYNRKPRNKYTLLYSTLYSTTSILLQKSLNLTPIQGFLGRLLLAALLRYYAFSSPVNADSNNIFLQLFITLSYSYHFLLSYNQLPLTCSCQAFWYFSPRL